MTETAEKSEAVDREAEPRLVDKARRLVQFLAAAQRLRLAPVRTADTYLRNDGAVFWLGEVPEHRATHSPVLEDRQPLPEEPFLVVQRVPTAPAPVPDRVLEAWLVGPNTDPGQSPALRQQRTVATSNGLTEVLELADHPEVQNAFDRWLPGWEAWAEQERIDRPVRKLYRELFDAYNTLTGQPELFELVLGVGCLAWDPSDHDAVRRHVLAAPAAIEFDDITGTLTVLAGAGLDPLTLELDMLDPALIPASSAYQDLAARARSTDAHPLDRSVIGPLLRGIVHSLDAAARYDDSLDRPKVDDDPVLALAPAVVLRRRSQAGLLEVFKGIEAVIAESGRVPAGLMPLVDPDYVPPVNPDPSPGAMVEIEEEVFLPLPLNERQLDIVQRVDRQAQTLVQGPPGTGKTHLAAALISHLLAQGKRVLVTAQTDRALKEVRGKLPEAIRPLAVAVLGTDQSDMADLKVAVEGISNRSNEGDPVARDRQMAADVETSLDRINGLRARRAALRTRLVEARYGEVVEREFLGYSGTLAAIARTYDEQRPANDWLERFEQPGMHVAPPLTDIEAGRWLALLRDPDSEADVHEALHSVDPGTVASPEQFSAMVDALADADSVLAAFAVAADHVAFERVCALDSASRSRLKAGVDELARRIHSFEQRRDHWMVAALMDIRSGRGSMWSARAATIGEHLAGAQARLALLDRATTVTIADAAEPTAIASLAAHLRSAVDAGRTVPLNPDGSVRIGTFASRVIKDSRPLFDSVKIDGRPPTTTQQLNQLLIHLDVEHFLDALDRAWPADIVVPHEDTLQERFHWHATELQLLQGLLGLGQDIFSQSEQLTRFGIPQPDWNDLEAILEFVRVVDAAAAREDREATLQPLQRLEDSFRLQTLRPEAVPSTRAIANAVTRRDVVGYLDAHDRLRCLMEVGDRATELDELSRRMQLSAPGLATAVAADPKDAEWLARLASLASAWDWARLGTWILTQDVTDANDLEAQLDHVEANIRSEIEHVAAVRAWRHALGPSRLTGQARADLNQYAQLVRRLGRGTGKYASARRTEIRRAMDNCRPAVPVWIMPIYRIADQLRVTESMFDVVIVDEASQAGLEATFLQYLAPKIVVIGDDKQVSPAAVGVDQQQLRDLAQQ